MLTLAAKSTAQGQGAALRPALWLPQLLAATLRSAGSASSPDGHQQAQASTGSRGSSSSSSSHEPPPPLSPPLPPPVLPSGPRSHWLESFGGLRHWLEDKQRHWWIRGLAQGRAKQYHQLAGREEELARLVEQEYAAALERHVRHAVDERAETHLQVAALALASHKALLPYLRDEGEVLQIIQEHMGGRTQALLRFLLRATRPLQRDGYATLTGRLRGLQLDMGRGFDSSLELGQAESTLTVTRCFYDRLFTEAGQPQLASTCCCSQDEVWLTAAAFPGVEASRTAAISAGDAHCCFTVRRRSGSGGVGGGGRDAGGGATPAG